eukprot:1878114-Rhodomonas_salina.6
MARMQPSTLNPQPSFTPDLHQGPKRLLARKVLHLAVGREVNDVGLQACRQHELSSHPTGSKSRWKRRRQSLT